MIIKTPSRLHITLIDMNGAYGRIDGGVGITIENPQLILEVEPLNTEKIDIKFSVSENLSYLKKDYLKRIKSAAIKMKHFLDIDHGFKFTVKKVYLSHAGLGSGTQLSLAVGKAISKFDHQKLDASKIAKIVGRGGTSGIGVRAFDYGGFIVDGGHNRTQKSDFLPSAASSAFPPPVIAHYDFPEDWKIVLAIPKIDDRVSGLKEVNIFQEYCPIPLKEVEKLSHLILMKMMPSVVENDLDSFGFAVNHIQELGFKKVELKLQNPIIGEIMENIRNAGAAGVGMSSFGPTIYAITDTNHKNILKVANESVENIGGKVILTKAQNKGAIIE
ncbi:MAG: beta-ribofuranosylaminobenzene 5'-phosphate synthase [Methanobacteriaceae archaeon]|nr:beta-ribofuranosylaminobenzene 5'-phosphate synthase [Methanobacteriaceae archaeon]